MAPAEIQHRRALRDDDPLEGLLRRCHRAELLPLAAAIGVNPAGLPLDRLAHAIARSLRRSGGNGLWNLLRRGGEGPPWPEVLRDLAGRAGVKVPGEVEGAELALQRWWAEQRWARMRPAEREAEWARLGLESPPPTEGALTVAQDRLGENYGYALGKTVAMGVLRVGALTPFAPLAGCATLWWLARPDDARLLPAVLEVAYLRQAVQHRLTIGVVGSPSSGKDAALKAVFGIDTGNVDPVAGSTTEVQINRLHGAAPVFVVNTPGLGDVVASVTEEARQILDLIDVYIYVVSAQGGVQQRERDDHARCLASGRPVLVTLNKIDTLKPADVARLQAHTAEKLGRKLEDVLPVAFDPLPQLAEAPIGIEPVRRWLRDRLGEAGKPTEAIPG